MADRDYKGREMVAQSARCGHLVQISHSTLRPAANREVQAAAIAFVPVVVAAVTLWLCQLSGLGRE